MNISIAAPIAWLAFISTPLAEESQEIFGEATDWSFFPGSTAHESVYASSLLLLGEPPIEKSRADYNSVRFLIVMSFNTTLAITVSEDNWYDETESGHERSSSSLMTVSFSDWDEEFKEIPNGNHSTHTVERYSVKISESGYEAIMDELFDEGLFHAPTHLPKKTLCADGTSYFIEAKHHSHYNFITRNFCHSHFQEDFQMARILISYARTNLPMLSAKFDAVEQNILSFGQQ